MKKEKVCSAKSGFTAGGIRDRLLLEEEKQEQGWKLLQVVQEGEDGGGGGVWTEQGVRPFSAPGETKPALQQF